MAAPTIIKSSDTGVPLLTRTEGAFIAVLDHCLPQRGWEKVFSSGTAKAVYRPSIGDRYYYRILNDNTVYHSNSSYYYTVCRISIYETMTDINTGSGLLVEYYIHLAGYTAANTYWIMIFDETGFYFLSNVYSAYNKSFEQFLTPAGNQNDLFQCHYFGETVPTNIFSNTPRFCASGSVSLIPTTPPGLGTHWIPNEAYCSKHLDGTSSEVSGTKYASYQCYENIYCTPSAANACYGNASMPFPYVEGNQLYYTRLVINGKSNNIGSFLYGYDYLPGLFIPGHPYTSLPNCQIKQLDGRNFLFIRFALYNNPITLNQANYPLRVGCLLFDISSDFRSPN